MPWWYTPAIPSTKEANAERSKFKDCLDYIAKPGGGGVGGGRQDDTLIFRV